MAQGRYSPVYTAVLLYDLLHLRILLHDAVQCRLRITQHSQHGLRLFNLRQDRVCLVSS